MIYASGAGATIADAGAIASRIKVTDKDVLLAYLRTVGESWPISTDWLGRECGTRLYCHLAEYLKSEGRRALTHGCRIVVAADCRTQIWCQADADLNQIVSWNEFWTILLTC